MPIALFLFECMVLAAHLSLAFLNRPLRSLNDFGLVDRSLYRWNWSRTGKVMNSGALVVLMLTTGAPLPCTAKVVGMIMVKVVSLMRLHSRGVPPSVGCPAAMG